MEIKERILFAPTANESELLRSLSKKGYKTFGLRVMNARDLALLVLERNGRNVDFWYKHYEDMVTRAIADDLTCAIYAYKVLKGIPYFKNILFHDAITFVKSIREFEMSMADDIVVFDVKKGYFAEKNEALVLAMHSYFCELLDHKLIDPIHMIRHFIEEYKPKNFSFDLDVYTLEEFPLKTLEKELLKTIKGYESNDFYEKFSGDFEVEEYNSFYGEKAEVSYIFDYIFKNKIKLDEVTIAVANNKYRKLIEDIASSNKIPVSYGISVSFNETNPGKLLNAISAWINNFYFKDNLINVFTSVYIDKEKLAEDLGIKVKDLKDLATFAGDLRMCFNHTHNISKIDAYNEMYEKGESPAKNEYQRKKEYDMLCAASKLAFILKEGIGGLLKYTKFSKINEKEEQKVLTDVINFINVGLSNEISIHELIEVVSSQFSVKGHVSSEGSIFVTSISKAKSALRKYLFVVGLSSELYPGASKEDYLVLDSDYNLVGVEGNKSEIDLENKKKDLIYLLRLNHDAKIFLSYPYYSTEDLKTKNASSLLFEIYNSLNGNNKELEDLIGSKDKLGVVVKHDYFDASISNNHELEKAYQDGVSIAPTIENKEEETKDICVKAIENTYFSASAIDKFFRCPYQFYLENILGFDSPFEVNPTDVMDSASYGNILHDALDKLDKNKHSLEDFKEIIKKSFDTYLITHYVLNEDLAKEKLEDLLEVGANAYELATKNQTFINEEDIAVEHELSGIKIHGFPDRSELTNDGKVIVIDYKTKNSIDHDEKDYSTCGQILTYAYIIKKNYGKEIDSCMYRYVKQGRNIEISENKIIEAFNYYDSKMLELKNSLLSGHFEKASCKLTEGICKYCSHKELCKEKNSGGDNDE